MEVGKAAAHSPASHYAKRWDAMSPIDAYYSTESWKERNFSARSVSTHTWSEGSATSASSSSPLFSGLPASVTDGGVDKVLYHNLVEMIPLVETLMEQQQSNKSFPRHASLVFTPNPRDASKASEHGLRAKKGHGQLLQDNQVDQNAIIAQLQDQMEQMEQKLLEKDSQLQAAENHARQADLMRFQAREEQLQEQIVLKEMEIEKAIIQLSETQQEVASLHCLLERAESDAEASNLNAAKVHEESQSLQCQVAALLLWMESMSSCLSSESADEEMQCLLGDAKLAMANGEEGMKHALKACDSDGTLVELTRRKYLASVIAARQNPTDEMLVLVAALRGQLQASLQFSDYDKFI